MYQERRRHMVYDEKGNVKLWGLAVAVWDEFRFPLLCLFGGVGGFVAYQRLVLWAMRGDGTHRRELDHQSEVYARASGKLRSDRFLVKPERQIDDPDMMNIPAFAGKGVYKSKLFDKDEFAGGDLQDERRTA
ncbi:hypothetical protein STCU_02671 [Strigomonas culicis]|uniref:Uncharacterized protein n=1 Tax=Strigomonas culicis TaxID=28005 RepID=S9W035_9TRYP|nr:hypothetical protein STCU_02671 [Strigomonas culicis]|eukprot:EPY32766.1 hypothetical protein STCU_02671 [Strigomonas culicis]